MSLHALNMKCRVPNTNTNDHENEYTQSNKKVSPNKVIKKRNKTANIQTTSH